MILSVIYYELDYIYEICEVGYCYVKYKLDFWNIVHLYLEETPVVSRKIIIFRSDRKSMIEFNARIPLVLYRKVLSCCLAK